MCLFMGSIQMHHKLQCLVKLDHKKRIIIRSKSSALRCGLGWINGMLFKHTSIYLTLLQLWGSAAGCDNPNSSIGFTCRMNSGYGLLRNVYCCKIFMNLVFLLVEESYVGMELKNITNIFHMEWRKKIESWFLLLIHSEHLSQPYSNSTNGLMQVTTHSFLE